MNSIMKHTRIIYIGFSAILAFTAFSCGNGGNGEQSLGAGDLPDQEFKDFTTMESDSGFVKWILKAPVARVYNTRKLLVTDNPRIEFFNEKGELSSVLTADKGEFNQVTHDLTALGNVVVTSSREGYTLETESLVWINELGSIHTEDFVCFTKENDVLTGYGFRSDPELEKWEIKRDVKAYLRDDGGVVEEEIRKEQRGIGKQDE
ncbi:MAG: LPS export ABC transporter periplasmic protein LptC [Candidatus Krumholzibacteria bacterium]|nr:LPS export ABC transporter periplasmic protein LptC [Candidatus Krumholzibacteria bacterium]